MKSHLNIQSILKKITAFQSEEAYSRWIQVFWLLWCSDHICWIFCRKYFFKRNFWFIVKLKIYRKHIFHNCHRFQIQIVFHIHCIYITVCSLPLLTSFLHLLIQFNASMFIDTDQRNVKHTNTEKKVDAGCWKTNFTCFRCQRDTGWVIDKYRFTKILSKYMLRYLKKKIVFVQIHHVHISYW